MRETDNGIAQQLVQNLAGQRLRYPENAEALAWAAHEHRDAGTRRLAQNYLLTGQAKGP